MKVGDFVGRKVRLLSRVTTRCGDVFDEGDVLVVESTWRGKLTLRTGPDCEIAAQAGMPCPQHGA